MDGITRLILNGSNCIMPFQGPSTKDVHEMSFMAISSVHNLAHLYFIESYKPHNCKQDSGSRHIRQGNYSRMDNLNDFLMILLTLV